MKVLLPRISELFAGQLAPKADQGLKVEQKSARASTIRSSERVSRDRGSCGAP
jgi:hypothetical protein